MLLVFAIIFAFAAIASTVRVVVLHRVDAQMYKLNCPDAIHAHRERMRGTGNLPLALGMFAVFFYYLSVVMTVA